MFKTELSMCSDCKLRRVSEPVCGRGNINNPLVMFIGESPGRNEVRLGKPFVGTAGKIFQRWVSELGLTEGDYYVTNACKCATPLNRAPSIREREACKKWLMREINMINPQIVVGLGMIAMFSIGGRRGYFVLRDGRPTIALYHPMAPIYDASKQSTVEKHLTKLKNFIDDFKQPEFDLERFISEEDDLYEKERRK